MHNPGVNRKLLQKMKQLLYSLSILLTVLSCSNKPELPLEIGAQAVAERYQTEVQYAVQKQVKDDNLETIIILKLEPNAILDTIDINAAASNMSLIMYENMSLEEHKKYNAIDISTTRKGQNFYQSYFWNHQVVIAASKTHLFETFSKHLIDGNYKAADQTIAPEYRLKSPGEELQKRIQLEESKHGKLKSYSRTSYALNNQETMIQIKGDLQFESGYQQPYVIVALTDSEHGYLTNYKIY